MAQPIASGVRVYTARPSLSLVLLLFLSFSLYLSLSATMASLHTIPDPRSFDPISHQVSTQIYRHTLTICSTRVAEHIFLLLSTLLCQLLALNRYFLLVVSRCHIGSSGEDHSWQLFYSFLLLLMLLLFLLVCVYVFCDIYIFVI